MIKYLLERYSIDVYHCDHAINNNTYGTWASVVDRHGWWVLFLLLIITALTKQYNYNIFTKFQIPLTPFHHWFGWLCFGILLVHFLLALFSSVFFVFF